MADSSAKASSDEVLDFQEKWSCSTFVLSKMLGVTKRRVSQMIREYGLPAYKIGNKHYFYLGDVLVWMWSLRERGDQAETEGHRNRLTLAQAIRVEMENNRRSGELIPAELVEQDQMRAAAIYAEQLDSLAGRLAIVLANEEDPAACERIIREHTTDIRESTALSFAALERDLESDLDLETSADPDRGTVGGPESTAPE